MIPYGRQDVTQDDVDAVIEVLRSDFLTQGPMTPKFEAAVAAYVGAAFGVGANSATSALHMACLALGLGAGDWLWTTPITFVASANCALYCGAEVDFVDIDERTYNLCPIKLEQKLIQAKAEGRLPKVLVPVHFSGQPCDMRAIHALAQTYGFKIIEDASHAIGARYLGERMGNGRYSDITIFSFHPVKIITTVEGGMAMTNDAVLAERMALFRAHGITRDPARMTHAADGPWYYQQVELGYNYRMNDLQAALGISQLGRIDAYLARRHELAARYDRLLAGLPLTLPWQHPDGYSGLHLYTVRLQLDRIQSTRLEVFEAMRADGVGVNVHYIPVHTQPYYRDHGMAGREYPESERYYAEAITLPLYPMLTDAVQDEVIASLRRALGA